MPTHAERRVLPYTPDQLYDLVADVERYPLFIPWCIAARIKRREGTVLWADMIIGFKLIREKFTSKVTLGEGRIDVVYSEGPFRYLNNHWGFTAEEGGGTTIEFFIDFEFRSRILQSLMGAVFNEAVRLMVGAFEKRARQLYGTPPAP